MKKLLVSIAAICISCSAYSENEFGFLIGGGLTFGGDNIAEFDVTYDDDDTGTEDLNAGELIHAYTGLFFRHGLADGITYGVQADVGYLFDTLLAENGDASFSRIPLELIPFLEYKWFRFGAGVTKHTNVELDVDLDYGGSGSIDFDDATGMVVIMEYMFSRKFSLGLRYVAIEYELSNNPFGLVEDFDGSHVGIMVNGLF